MRLLFLKAKFCFRHSASRRGKLTLRQEELPQSQFKQCGLVALVSESLPELTVACAGESGITQRVHCLREAML